MLRKSIFAFVFFAAFSCAFAGEGDLSPEMQCISKCIKANGWDNANACVNFCTG